MLGRERVKSHQFVMIFFQALSRLGILVLVSVNKGVEGALRRFLGFFLPNIVQVSFGFGLHELGQLVQHIGRLVYGRY